MRGAILVFMLAGCARSSDKGAESARAEPEVVVEPKDESRDEAIRITNEAVEATSRGEFELAEKLVEKAVHVDPANHTAWSTLGQLYEHRRDFESAANAYSQAVALNGDDASYHYRLGKAYWNSSPTANRAQAQAALERAVQLNENHDHAHYYLGLVYQAQGEPALAARAWTRAVAIAPSFGRPYQHLGSLYIRWNKFDEARSVLDEGRSRVTVTTDLAGILYHLGIAHAGLRESKAAIWAYSKSLEFEPGNMDALRQRGFAYAELGDSNHARQDLSAFVASSGGSSFQLQAARSRLARMQSKASRNITKPPVYEPTSKGGMPGIPKFEVPVMIGDAHQAGEMLVQGTQYLETKIKVHGAIVWIYDCAEDLRTLGMSKKVLKRLLREHPERCNRPHMHLADDRNAKFAQRIEVVELPRKPRPDELRALPQEMLNTWPEVPKLRVGDEVIVTGRWARQSPRGFQNSHGLLVYESVEPAKPRP